MTFLYLLISVIIISLIPLIGVMLLKSTQNEIIIDLLVSLAAGTLLGGAFLHLLPESIELLEPNLSLKLALGSIITFLLIEQVWQHHHCRSHQKKVTSFAQISLLGDLVHNLIDGLVLAGAFLTSLELGIAASLAIVLHEIPQEIGDTAILLKGGYSLKKALLFNLLAAVSAVAGALAGFYLGQESKELTAYLLPIAAGNFIYLAVADLIPQINHLECHKPWLRWLNYGVLIGGISLIALL